MLRCALAEWQLARARLLRSRLGVWLLLLSAGYVAVRPPAVMLAVEVGMLAAVLAIAFTAGADTDRAALALTLTHPTTPLAVALGRWIGATALAGLCIGGTLGARAALAGLHASDVARAAVAGVAAAGAAAACALAAVWIGGNALAAVLFIYIAVFSQFGPPALDGLLGTSIWRSVAGVLQVMAPAVWRYSRLAGGNAGAWLHAATWIAGGVGVAVMSLRRQVRR
jgi:hypothetical protein